MHHLVSIFYLFIHIGGEGQLSNFDLYVTSEDTEQETLVYNNTGVAYGDGVFTVNFSPVIPVTSAVIRRPTGNILVLCEVQIFDGKPQCVSYEYCQLCTFVMELPSFLLRKCIGFSLYHK